MSSISSDSRRDPRQLRARTSVLHMETSGTQASLELTVINESAGGYCCNYFGSLYLAEGDVLRAEGERRYEIRWLKKVSASSKVLGLMLQVV